MRAPVITETMRGQGFAEKETQFMDVQDTPFTARGGGVIDEYAAILSAVEAQGASGDITFSQGTYRIGTNLVLPYGLNLVFEEGALLSPDTGVTVTIHGDVKAGNYQIFTGLGTVTLAARMEINVVWYTTAGAGTTASRWVNGLRNAFAANGSSHHYHLPGGEYQDVTTIDLDGSGMILISGDGADVTKIFYGTADTTSCIKIHNGGQVCYEVYVRDLTIDGLSTCTGAALELEDIVIGGFENLCFDYFKGDVTAKNIWLKGRDRLYFNNIHSSGCTIGVHIDENPNVSIHLDHTTFSNMSFLGNDADSSYGFRIDALQFYNVTIGNNISFCKCFRGVWWSPSSPADRVWNFALRDLRFEQGDSVNKDCWAIYLDADSTKPMLGVTIENVNTGSNYNGIYLRYCTGVKINNVLFTQFAGYTQWDIGVNCENVVFTAITYYATGTRIESAEEVFRKERLTGGYSYIGIAIFDKNGFSWAGAQLFGSQAWDPGSIAVGAMLAQNITVTGAAMGDPVVCSFTLDVQDLTLDGQVTAPNVVTAVLANNTAGAVDLGNGFVNAMVVHG